MQANLNLCCDQIQRKKDTKNKSVGKLQKLKIKKMEIRQLLSIETDCRFYCNFPYRGIHSWDSSDCLTSLTLIISLTPLKKVLLIYKGALSKELPKNFLNSRKLRTRFNTGRSLLRRLV